MRLVALGAGGVTAFVVADDRWGRAAAIVAVVALVVVPFGVGMLIRRLARGLGKVVRAERFALHAAPLFAGALPVVACVSFARETGDAFARFPDRYDSHGTVGDLFHRIGVAIHPASASAPVSSTSASASASPAPSRVDAPKDEVAPHGDAGAPFTTGDVTYREDDCENLADVTAIAAAHQPGQTRATVEALARARYPMGLAFLQVQDDTQLRTWFLRAPDTFDGVASRFEAAVHEGSHMWGFKRFNGRTVTYPVRGDLAIETRLIRAFDRNAILARHLDASVDSYAKTYLEGSSGAQGFNTLLDEYNAYTHSLASRVCTRDLVAPGTRVSGRDGILTMMYYVETYLEIERTEHATDYAAILADAGHRRLILTIWDRAEFWLRRSAPFAALGIGDERVAAWVYEPARLAEIARVREAQATASRDR